MENTQFGELRPVTNSVVFRYAVEFESGYYAENQPNYEWSYTRDINSAKLYKTIKGADERGRQSGGKYRIIKVVSKSELAIAQGNWTSLAEQKAQRRAARGPAEAITLAALVAKKP
jgi:hypothetical protein